MQVISIEHHVNHKGIDRHKNHLQNIVVCI